MKTATNVTETNCRFSEVFYVFPRPKVFERPFSSCNPSYVYANDVLLWFSCHQRGLSQNWLGTVNGCDFEFKMPELKQKTRTHRNFHPLPPIQTFMGWQVGKTEVKVLAVQDLHFPPQNSSRRKAWSSLMTTWIHSEGGICDVVI